MENFVKQRKLENKDLLDSGAGIKVPVCICLDASYSMIGEKMNQAARGIQNFISSTARNQDSCGSVDLCVISFGGEGARVELNFTIVQSIRAGSFHLPTPSGGTPMGAAVELALEKIREREAEYMIKGMERLKPWLIIMSDGAATDNTLNARQQVRRLVNERKLKVKCIGIGDGDELGSLGQFSPNEPVESCDTLKIENFFNIVSQAAIRDSYSSIEDDDTVD